MQILSLADAAQKFEKSASHLRLLCRTGVIPAKKFGRDWVITATETKVRKILDGRNPGRKAK